MTSLNYSYQDLPNPGKQIRLLTIFPNRDSPSVIRTKLKVYNVPIPGTKGPEKLWAHIMLPCYFAISYRWIAGNKQSIVVNGQNLIVDGHVADALRVTRSYTSIPIQVWIDCICINQKNDEEKSQQIPLMPFIYGLSLQTLIWLGMPTDHSKQAANHIFRLSQRPLWSTLVSAYQELQSFTPSKAGDETPLAQIRRIVRTGFFRLGYALILRIFLPVAWVVVTSLNILDRRFREKGRMGYRFQTSDDYKSSASFHNLFSSLKPSKAIQNMYLDNLRQSQIHTLQKRASEFGEEFTEEDIAEVYSKKPTLIGTMGKSAQYLFRRRHVEAAAKANDKVAPDHEKSKAHSNPPPFPSPTFKTTTGENVHTNINRHEDKDVVEWTPSAHVLLSIDKSELRPIFEDIQNTFFSETEYFDRMWTLQEVCTTRIASFLYGGQLILTSDLSLVVHYLESELGIVSKEMEKSVRIQWINTEYLWQRRLPLRVLLYETRDRNCSNPRDKIYALLGLMLERPTILVKPAYDQPEANVYANATRFSIANCRSLDILCGHEQNPRVPGYPSWTPNFVQFARRGGSPLIELSGRNTLFKASSREAPDNLLDATCIPKDWQSLHVKGIYLGTIEHLTSYEVASEAVLKRAQEWKVSIQHHFQGHLRDFYLLQNAFELVQYCCYYVCDTRAPEARWLSTSKGTQVFHDLAQSLQELEHREHHICIKYLLTLICGRLDPQTRCDISDITRMLLQPLASTSSTQTSEQPVHVFFKAINDGTTNRRVFVTENANVRGAAPLSARLQDQVFVLVGCSVPVVLRLVDGNRYEFVGECYCEGVMDGEAEKDTSMRDIVLE